MIRIGYQRTIWGSAPDTPWWRQWGRKWARRAFKVGTFVAWIALAKLVISFF